MTYEEAISELETIKRVYANMREEYKPCVEALQMAIDLLRQKDEPQTEQWHYDEKDNTWYPYQHKSCATCKHALGNWDGESNNCGRCCGADRRFYDPIEDEQTKRSE